MATKQTKPVSAAATKLVGVIKAAEALGVYARISDAGRAQRESIASILEGVDPSILARFTPEWADATSKRVDATIRATIGAERSAKKGAPDAFKAGGLERLLIEAALRGYMGGDTKPLLAAYSMPEGAPEDALKSAKTTRDTVSKGVRRALKGLTPKTETEASVYKPVEACTKVAEKIISECGLTMNRALVAQCIAALSEVLEQALIDNAAVAEAQASLGETLV